MSRHSPSSVVFEVCGGSSYWAREMHMLGHEVPLIAPQYVKPFVKRQKNDATDAEAIVLTPSHRPSAQIKHETHAVVALAGSR